MSPRSTAEHGSDRQELCRDGAIRENTFLHDWIEAGKRPRPRRHDLAHVSSLMETARRALDAIHRRLHGQRAVWH